MTHVKLSPFVTRKPAFGNFLDDFFTNMNEVIGSDSLNSIPAVNVIHTKDAYKMELAAPGLEKKDFDLNIEKNLLTISVEKEVTKLGEDEKVARREFGYNKFSRSFRLPKTIKTEDISASYKSGVLKITLPKKEEAKAIPPRKVKIS